MAGLHSGPELDSLRDKLDADVVAEDPVVAGAVAQVEWTLTRAMADASRRFLIGRDAHRIDVAALRDAYIAIRGGAPAVATLASVEVGHPANIDGVARARRIASGQAKVHPHVMAMATRRPF